MTNLRFHRHFDDQAYLDCALRAGDMLLASAEATGAGQVIWRSSEGLSASFAHGSSGICLFLLYLHQATGREDFLETAKAGMRWVMSQGILNGDQGLTWISRDRTPSFTPYWRWGSSGIARVLVRFWHVTRDEQYASMVDQVVIDCDRKYTIVPGYFFGIAGIGELFLDLARFDRWKKISEAALQRIFAGCLLYAIERDSGVAFPGESLNRISCDLGTGGAGIAMVLHRYLSRCGASFMVDEILPSWTEKDGC